MYDFAGRRTSTWYVPWNFGLEGVIYSDDGEIAYRAWNGQTFFDHQDWQGTERIRTNYQGQVAETTYSLPFGDAYSENEYLSFGDWDRVHFGGLDHDSESYTEHAQFRQYSSTQGRWLAPDLYGDSYDPGNPQSFNRYSYVLNNPLALTDPAGEQPQGKECPGAGSLGASQPCEPDNGGALPTAENPVKYFIFCTIFQACGSSSSNSGGCDAQCQTQQSDGGGGDAASSSRFMLTSLSGPQQNGQQAPNNANRNLALFAGFPPQAGPSTAALYQVYWHINGLQNGQLVPHYSPTTGYAPSYSNSTISLLENQGGGFKPTGDTMKGTAIDNIYAGKTAPFFQKWFVDGQQVQVVTGGNYQHPVLAWTVRVVVTPSGPVYSAWP